VKRRKQKGRGCDGWGGRRRSESRDAHGRWRERARDVGEGGRPVGTEEEREDEGGVRAGGSEEEEEEKPSEALVWKWG